MDYNNNLKPNLNRQDPTSLITNKINMISASAKNTKGPVILDPTPMNSNNSTYGDNRDIRRQLVGNSILNRHRENLVQNTETDSLAIKNLKKSELYNDTIKDPNWEMNKLIIETNNM